jgi:hypothetical protein
VRNVNGRFVLNRRDRVGANLGQLEKRKTRGTTRRDLADLTESGDGTSDNNYAPQDHRWWSQPGRSFGRKGRTVVGESTSLDMLLTML